MFRTVSGSIFLAAACLYAQISPHAPADLHVTAASKSGVTLAWTAVPGAKSYQLERRIEPAPFAPVGAVTQDTSVTDPKVDVYATYIYRVKPSSAAASNEVKVGPPLSGFNNAALTPKDAQADFGKHLVMTLDANDDPVFAYLFVDPTRTNKRDQITLFFSGWDRAAYQWRKPIEIETGDRYPDSSIPVAIASDSSTGQLALVSIREGKLYSVALSTDNGVTWAKQAIAFSDAQQAQNCAVALAAGKIHLAFFPASGPIYFTGNTADSPTKWTRTNAPPLPNPGFRALGSLALDSDAKPAIAYLAAGNGGSLAAFYWRPGGSPTQVLDTNKIQNDNPDIRVAFAGLKPRVLFAGKRDSINNHDVWLAASDDGATWPSPVVVTSDGNRGMWGPLSIAVSPKGPTAVVSQDNGGNWDNVKCGWPKLSISPDGRQWATCSPTGKNMDNQTENATVAYAADGHLYLAYRSFGPRKALVIWRDGAVPAPAARPRIPVKKKSNP